MFKSVISTAVRTASSAQIRNASTVRVGIIGAGRIGQVHLETLAGIPNAKPVIISDVVEDVLKKVTDKFGVPNYSLDGDEVINHPDVDAVWICSPSQFHADQIAKCAAAGKHVFCEKPIATDLPGTIAAIEKANSAGIKLMTAFQRRFDPSFARLNKAIADGEIGQPINAILLSHDPAPPPFEYTKGGGGLFKDMAIHDLDVSRWMMSAREKDNEAVSVFVRGGNFVDDRIGVLKDSNPSEAIDTCLVIVTFANGTTATIHTCRKCTFGYDQRVEVYGTEGVLKHENVFPNTVQRWNANGCSTVDNPYDFFMSRYAAAYTNETRAFVDCLASGKDPSPSGYDGMMALKMAMACDISLKENRVVEISEIV